MDVTWRSAKRATVYALLFVLALPVVWRLLLLYGEVWFDGSGAEIFAGFFTFLYAVAAYLAVFAIAFSGQESSAEREARP